MSDNDGFFVRAQRNLMYDNLDIIIGQATARVVRIVKPMKLEFEELADPYGDYKEPSLRVSRFIAEPLLKAFADMLHQENIKPTTQSFIEGELVATKKHLEDMRKLALKVRS